MESSGMVLGPQDARSWKIFSFVGVHNGFREKNILFQVQDARQA